MDWVGGNGDRSLEWDGGVGGSLRNLTKHIWNREGKSKNCSNFDCMQETKKPQKSHLLCNC